MDVPSVPATDAAMSGAATLRRRGAKSPAPQAKKCALDQPSENLPTLKEIKDAVPSHCFEHSYSMAMYELCRDLTVVATFLAVALCTLRTSDLRAVDYFGWAMYAYWQGSAITGLWVLAHECGHGGFSASQKLNDAVGFVLHSSLLVPYYSWQFSHAKHHSKTNHLMDGESHNPDTWDDLYNMLGMDYHKMHEMIGDDAFAVWQLFAHLVFGWPVCARRTNRWPHPTPPLTPPLTPPPSRSLHAILCHLASDLTTRPPPCADLITNATGGRRTRSGEPYTSVVDHFRPNSELFPPSWKGRIAASSAGIFAMIGMLVLASRVWGSSTVLLCYIPPCETREIPNQAGGMDGVLNALTLRSTWLAHEACPPTLTPCPWPAAQTWSATLGSYFTRGCSTPRRTSPTTAMTSGHGSKAPCRQLTAPTASALASTTGCITASAPPMSSTTSSPR